MAIKDLPESYTEILDEIPKSAQMRVGILLSNLIITGELPDHPIKLTYEVIARKRNFGEKSRRILFDVIKKKYGIQLDKTKIKTGDRIRIEELEGELFEIKREREAIRETLIGENNRIRQLLSIAETALRLIGRSWAPKHESQLIARQALSKIHSEGSIRCPECDGTGRNKQGEMCSVCY